jgi:sugar lactone lactonase YvrE
VVYPTCAEVQVLPTLAFTRDGRDAYELLSGLNPRGLAADPATGELRALPGAPPCWPVASGARCDGEQDQAESLTLSPDEHQLYVTLGVDDAIVTFTRDPASGLLARRPELATCGGRSSRSPCAAVAEGLNSLVVSPDGRLAFALLGSAIVGYRRAADTGALTPREWPDGCLREQRSSHGCRRTRVADNESGVMSPDGRFLYVIGLHAVTIYRH